MSKYDEVDKAIVRAIRSGISESGNLMMNCALRDAAMAAAEKTRDWRDLLGRRLQALRKAGRIKYIRDFSIRGRPGWKIA